MKTPTDRTLRSPVLVRHEAFGELTMPVLAMDPIIRPVHDSLSNDHDADGSPIVRCAVRHLQRSMRRYGDRGPTSRRPTPEMRLREAVLGLEEFDPRPIEFLYPALHVRGRRGRTHSHDVVMQALCRAHRIAIPSPPMGIEAVSGNPPALSGDRPHTAIVGLPDGMPSIRFQAWCWSGEGTNISMRWPNGLEYLSKTSFSTITIPGEIAQTVLGHLPGRKADVIADVPGFDRITIQSAEYNPEAGRTIVKARHDAPIRKAA